MPVEGLLEAAGALLGRIDLVDDLTFSSRAAVARVQLSDGSTAIVKQPVVPGALSREVEALRILPADVRPALLAADERVVAMEDLGDGPSLADHLLGADAAAAEAALLSWSLALGKALAATLGDGVAAQLELDDPEEGLEALQALAAELEVAVPAGIDDDVTRLSEVMATPGGWVAFCPGDTCPDNNRILADGSTRLFDFEGAGWRHAALEAAYCRAPFCTCWCVAALPDGLTQRMEETFLDALRPPDASCFIELVPLAAARHTLVTAAWLRRFVLKNRPPGRPERSPCSGRQYAYGRLAALAGVRAELPALATLASGLADGIAGRWPDAAAMPMFPAFR